MSDKELSVSLLGCFRNVSLGEVKADQRGCWENNALSRPLHLRVKKWDVVRKDNFLPFHNGKHFLFHIKSF